MVRAVLRHVLGWLFLGLGVAGLVLPVLQGWLFVGIGAVLLSPDVPVFARLATWIEHRFPPLGRGVRALRTRLGGHDHDAEHRPQGGKLDLTLPDDA